MATNVEIKVKENESLNSALRRFKHAMQKERVITDIKKHQFYKSPSEERKRRKQISFFRKLKKK